MAEIEYVQTLKIYKHAPLTFQGQKSKWFAQFSKTLSQVEEYATQHNKRVLVVDVFGGSGLLSHQAKRLHPSFTVIYNDFDNYTERINNIASVNRLMFNLAQQFPEHKPNSQEKLTNEEANKLREYLSNYTEPIDAFCLSSWIQFSGTQYKSLEELLKLKHYYLKLPLNAYNEEDAAHYLDDIITIHEDAADFDTFQQILANVKKEHNISDDNLLTFYILDPPYLYCDKSGYKTTYFKLESSIDLVNYFIHCDCFMFFNSTKSGFVEFLEKLKKAIPAIRTEYTIIQRSNKTNKEAVNSEYALIRIPSL